MHSDAKIGEVPILSELELLWRGKRKYINRKLRSFQLERETCSEECGSEEHRGMRAGLHTENFPVKVW